MKMLYFLGLAVTWSASLAVIWVSWSYRLQNPDMADTRVFLNTWQATVPLSILAMVAFIFAIFMERKSK